MYSAFINIHKRTGFGCGTDATVTQQVSVWNLVPPGYSTISCKGYYFKVGAFRNHNKSWTIYISRVRSLTSEILLKYLIAAGTCVSKLKRLAYIFAVIMTRANIPWKVWWIKHRILFPFCWVTVNKAKGTVCKLIRGHTLQPVCYRGSSENLVAFQQK